METDSMEPWEKAIFNFLKLWVDERPYITLKTSGSTGKPKNIQLPKATMAASAHYTCKYLKLQRGDSALLCLPVDYIGGKMMIVRAFVCGLKITAVQPSSVIRLSKNYDFAAMTPHQLDETTRANPEIHKQLKKLILGGSTIGTGLMNRINHFKCDVYHSYGMTETSSHIALKKLNGSRRSTYFELITSEIIIGLDSRECLTISAPYLGEDEIITNDIVEIRDPMHFAWKGRWDNVINSGSLKIHPEEIEAILGPLMDFRFIIFSTPHKVFGERPAMLIEQKNVPDIAHIRSMLTSALKKIEIPEEFFIIDHFEETENGKIKRAQSIAKAKKLTG
jgi:O-succinylbenzoic acid--CoA ligase